MRIVWTVRTVAVLGVMALGMILVGTDEHAIARPGYPKFFSEEYKNLEEQVKKEKCGVCHYGPTKKTRNDYGTALAKEVLKIDKKGNLKNFDDFKKAAKAIEKEKSSTEGKTFGDLIKEGKLPGKEPEKKKRDKEDDK